MNKETKTLEEAIEYFSNMTKKSPVYLPFERQILRWLQELQQDREILDNIYDYSQSLKEKASYLSTKEK